MSAGDNKLAKQWRQGERIYEDSHQSEFHPSKVSSAKLRSVSRQKHSSWRYILCIVDNLCQIKWYILSFSFLCHQQDWGCPQKQRSDLFTESPCGHPHAEYITSFKCNYVTKCISSICLLTICRSFQEKCLFKSLLSFFNCFCCWVVGVLFILDISNMQIVSPILLVVFSLCRLCP